ncbi:MAG: antibiotic biosynthesis monooxygenase family protein [Bacteroidia bacterium]
MFHAVYLFTIKPGRHQDFERAWRELTDAIYRNAGSLGSKLLKQDHDRYLAIAQWPNAKSWEESSERLPGWTGAIRDRMRDCCVSVETVFEGHLVEDLTRAALYRMD